MEVVEALRRDTSDLGVSRLLVVSNLHHNHEEKPPAASAG